MEKENEKQALVAEKLLGADFLLFQREDMHIFCSENCSLGYNCHLFVCKDKICYFQLCSPTIASQ